MLFVVLMCFWSFRGLVYDVLDGRVRVEMGGFRSIIVM